MRHLLRNRQHPAWPLALLLAALWPHWVWMARRMADGSDEPWGGAALLALAALVLLDRNRLAARLPAPHLSVAAGLAVAAALCAGAWPPIVGAAAALLAVAALLAGMLPPSRPRTALTVLALLALPLAASLNFYLGYPLRWLCTRGSAWLLTLAGLQATPEGAALLWNGKTVLVDAPCAGVAMLWVGAFAAALLSYLQHAGCWRTAANLAGAALIVLAGNTVRNAILFFKEAGIVSVPAWTHEATGLLVFGGVAFLIFHWCAWRAHAYR